MYKHLLSGVCLLLGTTLSYAQPTVGYHEGWLKPNGDVRAVVQSGNTVYLGGEFTEVGYAEDNGTAISATTGVPVANYANPNDNVYASVPDGTGGWYIGGIFTSIDGQPRNRLAHINADGSLNAWNPNANGYIKTMTISDGTLYVGGGFTSIGGQTRNHIAAFNTATGALTSWNPGIDGRVETILMAGVSAYVGGNFTMAGGQLRHNIVAIDAASGVVSSWNSDADSTVSALAISGSTMYVGGYFGNIGGQVRHNIAAVSTATGIPTAWNPNANGEVKAIVVGDTAVYIGGNFNIVSGQLRYLLASVSINTGLVTAWHPIPQRTATFTPIVSVLSASGGVLYAGGTFTTMSGLERKGIAAFNMSTNAVTSFNAGIGVVPGSGFPSDNNDYYEVNSIAINGGSIYIGGEFAYVGARQRNRLAALQASDGMLTSWNPNANQNVYSLAISGNTIYAGGLFTSMSGLPRNYLAAIDATSGLPTAWTCNAGNRIWTLLLHGNTLYAGGDFNTLNGTACKRIAAIDATTGSLAATWNANVNNDVYALALDGNTLYAGGEFTSAGGQPRNRIAAIDITTGAATSWNPAANNTVMTLGLGNGVVYAGGDFTTIGGQPRNRIAALDIATGAATAFNPNADNTVRTLARSGNTLYAGGSFMTIGGQARRRIAGIDLPAGSITSWDPNAEQPVRFITVINSLVHVGGSFKSMNGVGTRKYYVVLDSNAGPLTPIITALAPAASLCRGGSVAVSFSGSGMATGNVYTAQLSDQYGSFAAPTDIGTLSSSSGGTINATIPAGAPAGSNYRIRIVSSSPAFTSADNGANLTVNVQPAASAAAISPAGTQAICQGSTVLLSAPAGSATYQWLLNGSNISGATANTYSTGNAGTYSLTVTNAAGCSKTSANKIVNVNPVPVATVAPSATQTICSGSSVTLHAGTAAGQTYQWLLNGNAISGATTSSYTASTAGSYTVAVTKTGCTGTASVQVNDCSAAPVITSVSPSSALCRAGTVAISFIASGLNSGNVFTAQLSDLSGSFAGPGNIGTLTGTGSGTIIATIPATQTLGTTYRIRVVASSPASAGPDNGTNLSVNDRPAASAAVISPAGSQTVCQGSTITLSAAPNAALTYQWRYNGNNVAGATGTTYEAGLAGAHSLVVANPLGCTRTSANKMIDVVSCGARLTMDDAAQQNGMSVYPNPSGSNATLLIHSDEADAVYQVHISDVTGRTVQQIELPANMSLSIGTELPAGVYTINAATGAGTRIVQKWVKE